MANEFEELLKGQEFLGTMSNMSSTTTNKVMHMIFLVDISGSMGGDRIKKVNEAFCEMVPALQKIQRDVNDAFELFISILTFGSKANWRVTPTSILSYSHSELVANGGGTDYGNAFRALEEKLTRNEFMAHRGKIAEPYIMFMTDGEPNDSHYNDVLEDLKGNLWFSHAQRYAVLIGKDAITNAKARNAVENFVTDRNEGIVTAAEAAQIVSVVSAKTIHTIKNMTIRQPRNMCDDEVRKNGEYTPSIPPVYTLPAPGGTSGDNPFGTEWDLNTSDIYGGNFNF